MIMYHQRTVSEERERENEKVHTDIQGSYASPHRSHALGEGSLRQDKLRTYGKTMFVIIWTLWRDVLQLPKRRARGVASFVKIRIMKIEIAFVLVRIELWFRNRPTNLQIRRTERQRDLFFYLIHLLCTFFQLFWPLSQR